MKRPSASLEEAESLIEQILTADPEYRAAVELAKELGLSVDEGESGGPR